VHPKRGVLVPETFIPIAEETGTLSVRQANACRVVTEALRADSKPRGASAPPRQIA